MLKEALKRNDSTAANIVKIGLAYLKDEVEFCRELPK